MDNSAIALVDCNNFYTSCEAAFDASLDYRPAVVLSNNDGNIISRNERAKQLGVTMGAPYFKVEHLLEENGAAVFSSNYPLYGDMSDRVMSLFYNFTPELEVYSIDEAFLSLEPRKNSLDKLAWSIKEKIYEWTDIPVSIGIAETKVRAKLANKLAKKSQKARGVLNLYGSPYMETALKRTDVADIWEIGRQSAKKLKDAGINTAYELAYADNRSIRALLTVKGARIALELRGIKCLPLVKTEGDRYSVRCTRSFPKSLSGYKDIREAIFYNLTRACEKMRRHKLAARELGVFISTDPFRPVPFEYSRTETYKSNYPTDINQELQQWTAQLLEKAFREGIEYRKAGVILSRLVPVEKLTVRMFDDEKYKRWRNLMKAIDRINQKFGKDTLRFAGVKTEGKWKTKATWKSPGYTTNWQELLVVH